MHRGLRLRRLDDLAEQLMDDGLAGATRRAYRAGTRRYRRFCRSHGLSGRPATEVTVLRFIAHSARAGLTAARISGILAGVRLWHVRRGSAWVGRTDRIRLALKGVAKQTHHQRRPRVAATPGHLRQLRAALRRQAMPPGTAPLLGRR